MKISTYDIMDLDPNMVETIAPFMPGRSQIVRHDWLTEEELLVYSGASAKVGFQSGLKWYRCTTSETYQREQELFADQRIDVPACFIAGSSDWGGYQEPGDFGKLKTGVCSEVPRAHLIGKADYWVQQEQPAGMIQLLIEFLESHRLSNQ